MQVTGWLAPAAQSLTLSSDHGQEGSKDNAIVRPREVFDGKMKISQLLTGEITEREWNGDDITPGRQKRVN